MFDVSRNFGVRLPEIASLSAAVSAGCRRIFGLRLLALSITLLLATQAMARDVVREQAAVEYARDEYERAAAAHKADVQQLERTRKALETLKKQLAQEQNKARQSAKAEAQAKAKLDAARQVLDRAWKQ